MHYHECYVQGNTALPEVHIAVHNMGTVFWPLLQSLYGIRILFAYQKHRPYSSYHGSFHECSVKGG